MTVCRISAAALATSARNAGAVRQCRTVHGDTRNRAAISRVFQPSAVQSAARRPSFFTLFLAYRAQSCLSLRLALARIHAKPSACLRPRIAKQ